MFLHGAVAWGFVSKVHLRCRHSLVPGKVKERRGGGKTAGVCSCCRTVMQGQSDTGSEGHQEFPKLEGRVGVLGSKPELDVRWNVLLRTQSQASSLLY